MQIIITDTHGDSHGFDGMEREDVEPITVAAMRGRGVIVECEDGIYAYGPGSIYRAEAHDE